MGKFQLFVLIVSMSVYFTTAVTTEQRCSRYGDICITDDDCCGNTKCHNDANVCQMTDEDVMTWMPEPLEAEVRPSLINEEALDIESDDINDLQRYSNLRNFNRNGRSPLGFGLIAGKIFGGLRRVGPYMRANRMGILKGTGHVMNGLAYGALLTSSVLDIQGKVGKRHFIDTSIRKMENDIEKIKIKLASEEDEFMRNILKESITEKEWKIDQFRLARP